MVSDAVKKMREAGKAYLAKKPQTFQAPTASSSALARQQQQSEAIERWKRGEITKEQAVELTKRIYRGGGTGAAADPRKYQLALEAEQKAKAQAEQKRQAELKAEAERKIAEAKTFAEKTRIARELVQKQNIAVERQRIKNLQRKLTQQNAQKVVKEYIDKQSRDKIKHETLINRISGERIFTTTNLRTGEVKTRTYERPKAGGRVRQTGGITEGGFRKNTLADIKEIQKQLPSGDKLIYNPKTMEITGISSAKLGMTIPYTDKGIDYYNKQISKVKPKFDFKAYANQVAETEQSIKEDVGKIQSAINKYSSNISTLETSLGESANRGDISRLSELQRKRNLTSSEEAEKKRLQKIVADNYKKISDMIGLTIATSILSLGLGSVELAKNLVRDPIGTVKTLPGNLWAAIKQDFARAKGSSGGALNVAVEYATIAGALKGIGTVAKGTVRTVSKINPKYVKLVNGKYVLRKTPSEIFKVGTTTRYLEKRVLPPSITRPFSSVADFIKGRKPGQFKKFTKDPGLILKTQTVATGAKPLSAQAKLASKEVTAVNAAADQLTTWLRRKKIIRKPIPGEEKFPTQIKNILNKFDSGKSLTTREFANVNLWLQKNVAPNITLLERSLYLDPASGLRISRLGIQATRIATLKDILKGNFRLWNKAGKPQVLIFENAKIATFPKSLNSIKKKLLADKPLTVAETNQLIRWQVQTGSGKFKPIGSTIYNLGKELEVTLAPGEMIKRIKRVGFTYIEGKRVSFVAAEVFKPTKQILNQIKKANVGKLSKVQVSSLEKTLSRKLGRKVRLETPVTRKISARELRRADANIPVLRIRGSGLFIVRRLFAKRVPKRPAKRPHKRPPKRIPKRIPKRLPKRVPKRPVKRVGKRPAKRIAKSIARKISKRPAKRPAKITRRPPKKPIKKPPIIPVIPKGFKQRKLRKAQPVYYVKIKRRGKIVNLNVRPLILQDAKDLLAYRLDHGLERSAWFEPIGKTKNIIGLPKNMKGYFNRNKRKLRSFKIRAGKKGEIRNGYIEKAKYISDTQREKGQLGVARQKAQLKRRPVKRKVIKVRPVRKLKRMVRNSPTTKRKFPVRRVVKRKISPQQRKVMLRNLAKARAIRMRNLKKN